MPRRCRSSWKCISGLAKVGAGARLRLFQAGQQPVQLALPRGGPDVVAHLIVKDNQPGRIPLIVNGKIEKRSRGKAGIVHLARPGLADAV